MANLQHYHDTRRRLYDLMAKVAEQEEVEQRKLETREKELQARKDLDPVVLQERLELELESEQIARKLAQGKVAQLEMHLESIQKQLRAIEAYENRVLGVDSVLEEEKPASSLPHHDVNQTSSSTQVGDSTAAKAVEPDNSDLAFMEPMERIFRRPSRNKLLGEGCESVLLKELCQRVAQYHVNGTPPGERTPSDIDSDSTMTSC